MQSSLFARDDAVWLRLEQGGRVWVDAPLLQRLRIVVDDGVLNCITTRQWQVVDESQVHGRLGDINVERRFVLGEGFLEEHIRLRNDGSQTVRIESAIIGVQRRATDDKGDVQSPHAQDRFVAIPFRRAPWENRLREWTVADLIREPGRQPRTNHEHRIGYLPYWQHQAEGWAWEHDGSCLAVLTGNDTAMQYGALAPLLDDDGLWMGLGAAVPGCGQHGEHTVIEPGEELDYGMVRYVCLEEEGFVEAMLAYRSWLDERGHRFPADYNPPLQWNELYDNLEWKVTTGVTPEGGWLGRDTRRQLYTLASMEEEAAKARAHGCEAIYLDPGWDTSFGSFIWDEVRLGSMSDFVQKMREQYDLAVCLHAPVAPWMSLASAPSAAEFPAAARRVDAKGRPIDHAPICLSSHQYLDEAQRRLLKLCEDGAAFIMLDGTFWMGPCHNAEHGHPVPTTYADHIAANFRIAQRIKKDYPQVLIELHDPITGGARPRWVPVYYGYDPQYCYDENWGFELMWDPFDDLRSGRARSLYYYALSCNVPVYLHIDLHHDNEHATVFWWYASTCRHLGIGGTHENPNIANLYRHVAKRYRELERFFKVGQFYGMSEEIHVHVLPDENSLVVNVFNLSDGPRRIEGRCLMAGLGIDPSAWFTCHPDGVSMNPDTGELVVSCWLPPWGNRLCELRAVTDKNHA